MCFRILVFGFLVAFAGHAQEGDKADEEQQPQVPREKIPPALALSADEALKTFRLQPGFRIELVASEPMIEAPICVQFDPDGRLWVLEMRGYMPNADGKGESESKGRVSVLEDTNGDGRMDKSTVFLDGLVMPRAMTLIQDGLLLAEPPKLWFCRDTNGDDKCDDKEEVANDYAVQADPKNGSRANHEHSANGLMRALDNWIYSANHTVRFRNTDGFWRREATIFRGQWGITQDDYGRLFYNSNEDPLRADFVPSAYLTRNPNYHNPAGANVPIYDDKEVWPVRVNPGVNRGYRKGHLRPDGTLSTFTAACAPLVYRGDNFPAETKGVFVCDPAGNLVKRYHLEDHGVNFKAKNAYDKAEFLASTDERFRPVHLANAPDGCLYIADMYRGIIQHHLYVTTYLRNQIMDRGLEKPTNLGRIYRVVHGSKKPEVRPRLSKASSEELANSLSHPNGWWRDTAQRLLIERRDSAAVTTVKRVAASSANPLGRLHALWVLEGLRQIDSATLKTAVADAHPKVRAAGIRLTESLLKNQPELFSEILKRVADIEPDVQLQLALTLSEVRDARAEAAMARIAQQNATNLYIRDALVTGLGGRELEFLERLVGDKEWNVKKTGNGEFLGALAGCVFTEANRDRVNRLLELAANRPQETAWLKQELLDGIINAKPRAPRGRQPPPKVKPVRLIAEPPALVALGKMQDKAIQERVQAVTALVTWPGKPGAEPEMIVKPLTPEQQKSFEQGKELYLISCGACHQTHGKGQEGLAPPLLDSEWVAGPPTRLVRMVLHGVRGPINVQGRTYELDMPSLGVFEDEQIAAVLTYIRREWGHTYDPVEPELVKKIRAETEKREEAWTELELLKIP